MKPRGVVLVGERRSGTNLLQVILGKDQETVVVHLPPILKRMIPLTPLYGDPENSGIFKQMIEDVCHLITLDAVEWQGPLLTCQNIFDRCSEKSFFGILSAILELCREYRCATRWIYKEGLAMKWREDIDRSMDYPLYVYLCRDPRDVASSFMLADSGEKHPYVIAAQWRDIQTLCLSTIDTLPPERAIQVRYEDLVTKPEATLRGLCMFLGTNYKDELLSFYQGEIAKRWSRTGPRWENLDKPLMANNIGKHIEAMSDKEISIIESVAGPTMDILGYPRSVVQPGTENLFTQQQVETFRYENERAKEAVRSKIAADRWEATLPQLAFIEEIKARSPQLLDI